MAPSARDTSAVARRAWRLMFDFLVATAPDRSRTLGRRGLTPNDARALAGLDADRGRTMRSLADEWGCDASNATWIIDRLERAGLAERRNVPHDRRVKLVVLTPKGVRIRTRLQEDFYAPPGELLGLDRADLEALERALQKLPPPAARKGTGSQKSEARSRKSETGRSQKAETRRQKASSR